MKKTFSILSIFILLIFSNLSINSCGSREDTVNCFPNVPINVSLNLNLPAYNALNYDDGWIYVNEQQSGTRGLIIVRVGNAFKVYDRNAPHLCPDNETTLEVKDNIAIVCPKDGTKWMLRTGQPLDGAKTSLPPKTYTSYNYDPGSKILNIYY
ncbi:hypothetical protein BBH99_05575 [Chryseobacterium contaminans]|uniref:Ferredoxin subunit of nitrite reductase or a ring-hydroxylating dioxygenase n=1 Tax=Chryseobacterium contaminans TaxID=1423959 RepID=A0A1M7HYN5_9FLAO|nr:hypothetical protein [Chryseobacterium contaminans]OCA79716.1 hypothetical protein BBH99_05575 [Chryseobacterium contaminans]SHM33661.1 hypothetical protein SAMN05444407_11340 [Chryseobacterium contaminans]